MSNSRHVEGGTALKRRLLEAMGWRVVSIPYFDWPVGGCMGVRGGRGEHCGSEYYRRRGAGGPGAPALLLLCEARPGVAAAAGASRARPPFRECRAGLAGRLAHARQAARSAPGVAAHYPHTKRGAARSVSLQAQRQAQLEYLAGVLAEAGVKVPRRQQRQQGQQQPNRQRRQQAASGAGRAQPTAASAAELAGPSPGAGQEAGAAATGGPEEGSVGAREPAEASEAQEVAPSEEGAEAGGQAAAGAAGEAGERGRRLAMLRYKSGKLSKTQLIVRQGSRAAGAPPPGGGGVGEEPPLAKY